MTNQLSLFDSLPAPDEPCEEADDDRNSRAEKIAHISWSYSRRSLMEKCLRCYYYEYFGGNKRTAKQENNKQEIWQLKQLKSRHERAGDILHFIISSYLRKLKEGVIWDTDRLISWARDTFNKDIAFSQSINGNWDTPKEKYPPALLQEFFYHDPEALEKCLSVESALITALKSFMTNPLFAEFRRKGGQNSATIEGFIKLNTVTPCKIEGRIDLAYPDEARFTVVDWKLGHVDGIGDDSLQLAAYGLWAVEAMRYDPTSIRICKVHFGSEKVVDFECNEQVLAMARIRIMQDAERMAFLESYGKKACIEAFTPCNQEAICRQCAFVGICHLDKEEIHA